MRTLRRAIETDRVAHAYLFSGPRGTGKTSTAKVLAMGLNCEKGPTAEPDGTCESCRAIINNSSMDVLEMDAASNRGIDEIRELRDRVNLAPAAGRMKVYIIDEVHMLTTEAFNALLKMLEEPPEHVVFVLATTEKHKVLPTIISRCQSFDFRRPGVGTLAEKLAEIAEAEGIEVEPGALTIIAREGQGSFRDAEGLLDQLSSFAEGEITAGMVRELLGGVGPETLLETTAALHDRRAAVALKIVDRLSNEGRDLGQFVGELLAHLRRLMLLPHAPDVALAEVGSDERAPLEEQAAAVPAAEVVRLVEALGDALGRIKRGGDPKLELELTFLKLARDYTEPDVTNLLRRLEALETAVADGAAPATARQTHSSAPQPAPPVAEEDESREPETEPEPQNESEHDVQSGTAGEPAEPAETAEPDDTVTAGTLAARWPSVVQDMKDRRHAPAAAVYEEARVEGFEDNVLELAFPRELAIYAKLAGDARHVEALHGTLEKQFGVRPRLECRVGDGQPDSPSREAATPQYEAPQREVSGRGNPAPRELAVPQEDAREPEEGPGPGTEVPEAAGGNDTIRSEQEVFALAREWFGPAKENGGN